MFIILNNLKNLFVTFRKNRGNKYSSFHSPVSSTHLQSEDSTEIRMETEGRKRGRGPLERLYRLIMRRNSVYVTFVIVGAFLGERVIQLIINFHIAYRFIFALFCSYDGLIFDELCELPHLEAQSFLETEERMELEERWGIFE